MSNKSKIKKPKTEQPLLKLDLGCGKNKQPGHFGVDLYSPDADLKLDLTKFPWPWKNESVSEIFCSHFIEHLDQSVRYKFFEECWRILKPDGIVRIIVPSWKSERAYGDQDHKWPPVVSFFFLYLNKAWREANKLTYGPYDLKMNFEHQSGPTSINPEFSQKAHEVQVFACQHYFEAYPDCWCTLTKKPL